MVNRLSSVSATLHASCRAAGPHAQRALARAVALAAVEHTRLDDDRLTPLVTHLRTRSEAPDLAAAKAAVEDLDTTAFDAQDRFDDGIGSEADYTRAFIRARAASAAIAASDSNPFDAVAEALYEAFHVLGEDSEVLHAAIDDVLRPGRSRQGTPCESEERTP